jgi:hypothetical protein
MKGLRRGDTEWQTVTWTIDRAKDLGLTGKENWKKQPQAMLLARATSELARLIAADAILGIGYTVEEIADGGPVEQKAAETVDATPTGTRRMSRKATTTPEVPAEPETPIEPELVEGITQPQSKKLHAGFNDLGITDREQRLAYCTNLIGREITSSNDLTKDEASRVIDALETDAAPGPELFEGDE